MTNTPRIIGVCLSMLPEEYRLQCVRALNKYAVQQGYRLFIFPFQDRLLSSAHTDG